MLGKLNSKKEIILTSANFRPIGLSRENKCDPELKHFYIRKADIMRANLIIFHSNGRKKVLKSRELPDGWMIDYYIHIEWEANNVDAWENIETGVKVVTFPRREHEIIDIKEYGCE